MVKEVYNELEFLVYESANKLKKGQEIIESPDYLEQRQEIAALMQEVLLELDNFLEDVYKLHHSEILTLLKK